MKVNQNSVWKIPLSNSVKGSEGEFFTESRTEAKDHMRTEARQNVEVDDATASWFLNLEVRHLASATINIWKVPQEIQTVCSEQIGLEDDIILSSSCSINKITESTSLWLRHWPADGSLWCTHTFMQAHVRRWTLHTHTHNKNRTTENMSSLSRQRQMFLGFEFALGGDELKGVNGTINLKYISSSILGQQNWTV